MDKLKFFPQVNNNTKKIVYWIVTLAVTILFIYLCWQKIDWEQVRFLLSKADWRYIFISVVLSLITSVLIAVRMKLLFSVVGSIALSDVWLISQISNFVAVIIPFYVGAVSAIVLFSKALKVSVPKVAFIIFLDYFLTLVLTLIIGVFAVFYFGYETIIPDQYQSMLVAILIMFVLLFIAIPKLKKVARTLNRVYLLIKKAKSVLFKAGGYTIIIHILVIFQMYCVFLGFGVSLPLFQTFLAFGLFSLLTIMPVTPLRIGQYEVVGIVILPQLLQVDATTVFLSLSINHALSLIVSTIIGYVSVVLLSVRENLK